MQHPILNIQILNFVLYFDLLKIDILICFYQKKPIFRYLKINPFIFVKKKIRIRSFKIGYSA